MRYLAYLLTLGVVACSSPHLQASIDRQTGLFGLQCVGAEPTACEPPPNAIETEPGFYVSGTPGIIASSCRLVERGGGTAFDHKAAAYGYEHGICGPDSYAAQIWGGYPAQR
jgi:hypothetical protein